MKISLYKKMQIFYNRISVKAYFIYLMAFLLISPFDRLFPFSIKRILLLFFLLLFFLDFLFKDYSNPLYYFLFLVLIFVFIRTSISKETKTHFFENFEDYSYFACTLICLVIGTRKHFIKHLKSLFIKYKYLILAILILCYLSFLIAYFLPNKYGFDNVDDKGFRGFTTLSHSAASLMIFIIILLLATGIKNPLLYIPAIAILYLTKARTFLVLLLPLSLFYIFMVIKNKKIAVVIFFSIILFGLCLVFFTPLKDKFLNSGRWYKYHPIDAITSNRSLIWTGLINHFVSSSPMTYLFGESFSFVRNINELTTRRLWAHNDFIEVLLSTGFVGLTTYLFFFLNYILLQNKSKRILLFVFFFTSAFLNGLMLYFVLSLSFTILPMITTKNENVNKEHYLLFI